MINIQKHRLLVEQADKKLAVFRQLNSVTVPPKGWINTVRVALKMSMRQLGNRLGISPQSVKEIEEREANGSLTLKGLREAGAALQMKLIYGFIPKSQSLEQMIEMRAMEIAKEIVQRTSTTMQLEDQANTKERLDKAIRSRAEEIKMKMPKYLWD